MKYYNCKFLFFFLALTFTTFALTFDSPVLIHPQDYSSEGSPTVIDWDEDGLKDILFGERMPSGDVSNSNVGFWKNSGTSTEPSFSDVGNIKADGSDINIEVG